MKDTINTQRFSNSKLDRSYSAFYDTTILNEQNNLNSIDQIKLKIVFCKNMYDFEDFVEISDNILKKETLLNEIIIHQNKFPLSQILWEDYMDMITINIFSRIINQSNIDLSFDEECEYNEVTWPHLSLIYDSLIIFVTSVDNSKTIHKFLSRRFVSKLMKYFQSEDVKERKKLILVIHSMYKNFLHLRRCIINEIADMFHNTSNNITNSTGISEILEFFYSVLSGYCIPLKSENMKFFDSCFKQLFKSLHFHRFNNNFYKCLLIYHSKGVSLSKFMFYSLKNWPKHNTNVETCLLEIYNLILIDTNCKLLDDTLLNALMIKFHSLLSGFNFRIIQKVIKLLSTIQSIGYLLDCTITRNIHCLIVEIVYNFWSTEISSEALSSMYSSIEIHLNNCNGCNDKLIKMYSRNQTNHM